MALRIVDVKNFRERLDEEYATYLHGIVDEIFIKAADVKEWSWVRLASEAGISYSTVLKLGNRLTLYPRHMTVWKLAKAVGLSYELQAPPQNIRRRAG